MAPPKGRSIPFLLILVMLIMASGAASGVPDATAGSINSLEIVSVTLDGGTPWTDPDNDEISTDGTPATVPPNGAIEVFIVENNGTWTATEWVFQKPTDTDTEPTFACIEIPVQPGESQPGFKGSDANPRTHAFTITAPDGPDVVGSYDLTIIIHPNKGCQGTNVDKYTMLSAFGVSNFPVAAGDAYTTTEDTPLSDVVPEVLANDTDVDTKAVTAVNGSSPDVGKQITLPSFGALLTLNEDGSLDYDPNGQFNSLQASESTTDSFTYTVEDLLGATSSATVTVTINGVNDPPVSATVPDQSSQDGATGISVDASTSDVDDATLTYSTTGLPGGLSIYADTGSITGTLDSSASQGGPASDGIYLVEVTADDGNGGATLYRFTWTVTNPAPLAATVPDQSSQDGDRGISVDASTSDVDDATLTYSATGLPGGLSIHADTGWITGTLDSSASQGGPANDGIYLVEVTADDGNGGATLYRFTWAVTNPAPLAATYPTRAAKMGIGASLWMPPPAMSMTPRSPTAQPACRRA